VIRATLDASLDWDLVCRASVSTTVRGGRLGATMLTSLMETSIEDTHCEEIDNFTTFMSIFYFYFPFAVFPASCFAALQASGERKNVQRNKHVDDIYDLDGLHCIYQELLREMSVDDNHYLSSLVVCGSYLR
jgi:hypothetical protein